MYEQATDAAVSLVLAAALLASYIPALGDQGRSDGGTAWISCGRWPPTLVGFANPR